MQHVEKTVKKQSHEMWRDRRHTHVCLISRSDWSDRSSPSGSTQCPSQRRSVPANGQGAEERLVVWQSGEVGSGTQEEERVAIETGLRNPRQLPQSTALVGTLTWEMRRHSKALDYYCTRQTILPFNVFSQETKYQSSCILLLKRTALLHLQDSCICKNPSLRISHVYFLY